MANRSKDESHGAGAPSDSPRIKKYRLGLAARENVFKYGGSVMNGGCGLGKRGAGTHRELFGH
jgi:hypothetical protein